MSFPYPWSKDPGQTRRFLGLGAAIYQPYEIPLGANFLSIIVAGGGGSGGSGFSAAAAAARGGGAGGSSGALTRMTVPTVFLPKTLYVFAALGGASGAGGDSFVAFDPSSATSFTLIRSNGGLAGGNGSGTAGGTAGAVAGATSVATSGPYSSLGPYQTLAGQAGAAGGAQTGVAGGAVTFGANGIFVSPGAGGGGTTSADFAGGNITGSGLMPTVLGGLAGSNAGAGGFELWLPPTFGGGGGGGASNAGVGGAGGAAGPGSGGGGGGGGTTGGTGGRGGPGFVLITAIY